MPALFLGLLAKRGVAFFGVALMLGALLTVQSARLSHAKADLSRARHALIDPQTQRLWRDEAVAAVGELRICGDARRALSESLAAQNQGLEKIKQEGARATARAAYAMARARQASTLASRRAQQVMAVKRGSDGCRSADALILRSLD